MGLARPGSWKWLLIVGAAVLLAALALARFQRQSFAPVLPADRSLVSPPVLSLVDERVQDVRASPHSAARHANLGLAYEANLMWPEAQASYRQAILLDADEVQWRYRLAVALEQGGNPQAALLVLDAAVQAHPVCAPCWQRRATLLFAAGRADEAAAAFAQVIKLEPQASEGHAGLAEVLLAQRDHARAESELRHALELAPANRRARYQLGLVLRATGREEEAAAELAAGDSAASLFLPDPHGETLLRYARNPTSLVKIAERLMQVGRVEEAIGLIEQAVAADPENPALHANLGHLLLITGQPMRALPALEHALKLGPDLDSAYINLGECLTALKKFAEAIAIYDQALQRNLAPQKAHLGRGRALQGLGRTTEAIAAMERAVAIDPDAGAPHLMLGLLHLYLGDRERGRQELELAARDRASFDSLLGAAEAFLGALDDRARARELLAQAELLAPGHPRITSLRRRLEGK